jgi:hypothetical protein
MDPEGHTRVMLELMSAGFPVVTIDRGAIADIVIDGQIVVFSQSHLLSSLREDCSFLAFGEYMHP